MTQEEKVKAYDRALEIAKAWHKLDNNDLSNDDLETLFPSLKEPEDEKIRKWIINEIKIKHHSLDEDNVDFVDKAIGWLEKQGEQKEYTFKSIPRLLDMIEPTDRAKAYCQKLIDTLAKEGYNTDTKIVEEVLKGWNGENIPMAIMDEQKPINKIEPKFKVGDWITDGYLHNKITDVLEDRYIVDTKFAKRSAILFKFEHYYHLWTLKDAKDGDVLCDYHEAYDNPLIFILKKFECVYFGLTRPSDYSSYCFLTASDRQRFKEGTYHHEHNIRPATKEQRDLLFQKMKEAGYEWDAENLQLTKILPVKELSDGINIDKQKPTWSEDKKLTDVNHEYFSELLENSDSEDINDYAYQVAYCMSHDWIEETPTWDDVQKACKLGAEWKEKHWNNSSTAWSKEDEAMLDTMEGWLDTLCEYLKDSSSEYVPDVESCINWLKSLKQKIGG